MEFVVEVVVDRGMNGGEFLQSLYVPESGHCRFPSSERLVQVPGTIGEPSFGLLANPVADRLQRRPV